MTFQKIISLKNLVFATVGVLIVLTLITSTAYSCGIQHMVILNEINLYQESLDPEFCETVVEKIDLFNDDCEPPVQILDCG